MDNVNQYTRPMLEELKKLRQQAVDEQKSQFWFEEQLFRVDYAKYLIAYLETQLA